MKKKKKILLIGGVVIVVAILGFISFKSSSVPTTPVQTQKAKIADIVSVVSGSGRVEPKTKVNIVSEVNAVIIQLPVKEGDYVRAGQMLIQLDTIQLKSDMESALYAARETEARVNAAGVILEQNRTEYDRQKGLFDKKLTSEQAYQEAMYSCQRQEAEYKAWVEQKKASDSRLAKAQDNLRKTTIRSPMNGIITLVDAEKGEIAQAQTSFTQGKTLLVVSDLSAFEIEVEIDETDIADVTLHQKSSVEIDAFPDTAFAGEVVEIGNTAGTSGFGTNEQQTNFKVKVALIEKNERIRPGMSATVDITTNEHKSVLTVPIQAVVLREFDPDSLKADTTGGKQEGEKPTEEGTAVASTDPDTATASADSTGKKKKVEKKGIFVNREGVARFSEITLGIADQQNYEVISGLTENDEVVTGSFRTLRSLKDGDNIKVENREKKEE